MPVMDGLQATRLIRSFEETGNWEAAVNAGVEPTTPCWTPSSSRKRMPIIAVSITSLFLFISPRSLDRFIFNRGLNIRVKHTIDELNFRVKCIKVLKMTWLVPKI